MTHMLPFDQEEKLGLTGERILADRYLQKGGTLENNKLAVATLNAEKKYSDLVTIVNVGENTSTIRTRDGEIEEIENHLIDVLKEVRPREMWERIAKGVISDETWQKEFTWLQEGWKYVPGGRINASMGTGVQTTSYNCFVIPSVGPTLKEYAESFGNTLEIQARSGGVGMNLSLVPPEGTLVEKKPVDPTDLQLVLDVWHPDLLEFLDTSYPHSTKVVRINRDFIKAMQNDEIWTFEFPDTKTENYDEIWNGDLKTWKKAGYPTVQREPHLAKDLYRKMIQAGVVLLETVSGTIVQPKDERGSIALKLSDQWENQVQGKLVSVVLSSLRPNHSRVYGVNGRSSGAHSWGTLYDKGNEVFANGFGPVGVGEIMSVGCQLTLQGGSRRGALMLVLNDWHADILRFITAKQVDGVITGANISVGVSDEFMEAKENGQPWKVGYLPIEQEWNDQTKVPNDIFQQTEVLNAKELWETICTSAWKSAEPGVIFLGRANRMSNSWYFNPLVATNPCGEQPLPPNGICNLGAVVLGRFVVGFADQSVKDVAFENLNLEKQIRNELRQNFDTEKSEFFLRHIDWESLEKATRVGLRFQNAVIDATYYPFEANRINQMNERRVGLGIMGLHDMLLLCGVRYGSEESVRLIDVVLGMMAEWCYSESSRIAKEDGPFPAYDSEKFFQSGYMQQMAKRKPHVIEEIKANGGVRNVTTMTIAPTGTTGTMVGCSTGCEPYYAWTYFRNSRLGLFEENAEIIAQYLETHPELTVDTLPDYFVTAMDLSPEEHVRVQGACQVWVDSAISKTCNAPNSYTVEDTIRLYDLANQLGCKGITIYRDGSRSEQVLELKKEDDPSSDSATQEVSTPETIEDVFKKNKRPGVLYGATYKKDTPHGMAYITINDDPENGLSREIFVNIGKAGTDIFAANEALGRAITLYLKDSQDPNKEAVLVKHFSGIGGQNTKGFGENRITSVPDAIAKAVIQHAETFPLRHHDFQMTKNETAPSKLREATISKDICPNCHQVSLIRNGGCKECEACGYSAC